MELKACPFCGKVPEQLELGGLEASCQCVNVKCHMAEEDAIYLRYWNTRPIEDALQTSLTEANAEVKRLALLLEDKSADRIDNELSTLKSIEKEISKFDVEVMSKYLRENKRLRDALEKILITNNMIDIYFIAREALEVKSDKPI